MNRRGFLLLAGGLVGAAALDPEALLWTPKKTIFIPRRRFPTYAQFIQWQEFERNRALWLEPLIIQGERKIRCVDMWPQETIDAVLSRIAEGDALARELGLK